MAWFNLYYVPYLLSALVRILVRPEDENYHCQLQSLKFEIYVGILVLMKIKSSFMDYGSMGQDEVLMAFNSYFLAKSQNMYAVYLVPRAMINWLCFVVFE